MGLITYQNKVALNENPSVEDINKVKASDMNEIKQVVNANYEDVGDIADLETEDMSSIVNAINEVNREKGAILWNNPNPSATTGAGTVQLDLSNAKVIMIICKIRSNIPGETVQLIVEVGKTSHIQYLDSPSNVIRLWHRTVTVNINNLVFGEAYINDSEKRDDLLIPIRIIKIN